MLLQTVCVTVVRNDGETVTDPQIAFTLFTQATCPQYLRNGYGIYLTMDGGLPPYKCPAIVLMVDENVGMAATEAMERLLDCTMGT
jgi:hypothetical protein